MAQGGVEPACARLPILSVAFVSRTAGRPKRANGVTSAPPPPIGGSPPVKRPEGSTWLGGAGRALPDGGEGLASPSLMQEELHPPVLFAAGGGAVVRDGLARSVAHRGEA